jgi:DNA-binding transcriptional regulator YdaS (Cro superfamily)
MEILDGYIEISVRALIKATRLFGSEHALAKKLGVSRQSVNHWKMSNKPIPYDKALKIYIATEGRVELDELRPDLKNEIKKGEMLTLKKYNKQNA